MKTSLDSSTNPLPRSRLLTQNVSVLLDAVRLLSALGVFFCHAYVYGGYRPLANFESVGSNCVVVFFILSGFVISNTTTVSKRNLRHYTEARLGRLYSVLVPAMVFTLAAILTVNHFQLEPAGQFLRSHETLKIAANLLFLHETWGISATPGLNVSSWSLAYEFWYYLAFAAFIYASERKVGVFLVIAVLTFAGVKILLLAPIWFLGICLHEAYQRVNLSRVGIILGLLASMSLVASICVYQREMIHAVNWGFGYAPLFFSGRFLFDYVFATATTLAFFFLLRFGDMLPRCNRKMGALVRHLANMTFTLYLFHLPLIWLLIGLLRLRFELQNSIALSVALILPLTYLLSFLGERRKQWWRWVVSCLLSLSTQNLPFLERLMQRKPWEGSSPFASVAHFE